jgi:hypothetical protein
MSRSRGKGYRWYVPPIPHYAQTATESCAHRHDIQPHGEYRFWNRCCREPVHALRLSRNIPVTRRRSASPSSHLISYIYLFFLLGLPPLQSHTQRLGQHRKLLIQGEFVNLAEYVSSFSQLLRISSFEWTLAAIGSRATTGWDRFRVLGVEQGGGYYFGILSPSSIPLLRPPILTVVHRHRDRPAHRGRENQAEKRTTDRAFHG